MQRLARLLVAALVVVMALTIVFIVEGAWRRQATPSPTPPAGHETMAAVVLRITEEGTVDLGGGQTAPYQKLLVYVESGSLAGQEVAVEEGTLNVISQQRLFRPGDRVFLERMAGQDGDRLFVSDYRRTAPLAWILGMFLALVLLVGRGKGARSLAGMLLSLIVIFAFIVPQILAGRDPVTISIIGSAALLAGTTYLIYGWTLKAHAAMVGMLLSLVLTGVLAWLFVEWARLTGLSEESAYLVMELGPGVNLQGLVLGGIIIGSLGVLDDICVGQASAAFELAQANPSLGRMALFRHVLTIGRDHIAAMVNTLLLAYVGASMPLVLVLSVYAEPLLLRLNREPIAEEIVRTLVGSIGLVLAVPITSLIASLLALWSVQRFQESDQ
jgi:uncharacterized membrane protein